MKGIWLTCAVCLSGASTMAAESSDPVVKAAVLEKAGSRYELRLEVQTVTVGADAEEELECSYTAYRDGERLRPDHASSSKVVGCEYVQPEKIEIERFSDIGFMFGVGGICGNTFSWRWTIVVPGAKTYRSIDFETKSRPVIRAREDHVEIWSTYQEWGNTGTAGSFFVPELRCYQLRSDEPGFRWGELPAALGTWPELEYLSDFGIFVAGIAQLNPEIMRAALARGEEGIREFARLHLLPAERGELLELIAKVEVARDLRAGCGQFARRW